MRSGGSWSIYTNSLSLCIIIKNTHSPCQKKCERNHEARHTFMFGICATDHRTRRNEKILHKQKANFLYSCQILPRQFKQTLPTPVNYTTIHHPFVDTPWPEICRQYQGMEIHIQIIILLPIKQQVDGQFSPPFLLFAVHLHPRNDQCSVDCVTLSNYPDTASFRGLLR